MKTEPEIQMLLDYLYNYEDKHVDWDNNTYTSIFEDNNGKFEVFTDQAFESIIDKISAAKKTLEWVIEQTVAVKEVTSEKESTMKMI